MSIARSVLHRRWRVLGPTLLLAGLCLYGLWPWLPVPGRPPPARTLVFYGFSILGEVMTEAVFPAFREEWRARTGEDVEFISAFAGSGTVRNQIAMGVPADVALLALELDAHALAEAGVVEPGSWKRLPHGGVVNRSPIVILAREGNPHGLRGFADLARPGVSVVHPDPLTSGAANWALLAEYGAGLREAARPEPNPGPGSETGSEPGPMPGSGPGPERGPEPGPETGAERGLQTWREGVRETDHAAVSETGHETGEALVLGVWRNVGAQAGSARSARTQFDQGFGDALVTYEQEVLRDRAEGRLEGEIVYPRSTIATEHTLVVIEKNVRPRERELVEAFVAFLWSARAQRLFVEHGFRGVGVPEPGADAGFGEIADLFSVADLGGWSVAAERVVEGVWKGRVLKSLHR